MTLIELAWCLFDECEHSMLYTYSNIFEYLRRTTVQNHDFDKWMKCILRINRLESSTSISTVKLKSPKIELGIPSSAQELSRTFDELP